MPPPGLLSHHPYPGATTCILVGDLPAGFVPDAAALRAVLWIADHRDRTALQLPATAKLAESSAAAWRDALLIDFLRLDPRRLPTLLVTTAVANDDRYAALLAGIHAELESTHRARVTRQQDGFAWQRHVLKNLPDYIARPLPESWRGVLAGVPAFVCGAGPSFEVSAPALASVASRGVVLAGDSSLRALARHGVQADIVVSIDVAKVAAKCVPPDAPAPRLAVLSPVSPPDWAERLPDTPRVFVSGRQITTDWIAAQGIIPPALAVAENCGVTALELARFLGCAPIYLFGLDLALTARQRHGADVDPTLYARSGFNAAQQYPEVPGNYADRVPTHVIGDWRALDARLATWPAGLVHNVTDRGARLGNTTVVHPDKLADALAGATIVDPHRLGSPVGGVPPPRAPAGEGARPTEEVLAQIASAAERGRQLLPELRLALQQQGPGAVVPRLRGLFTDPTLSRVLGSFALKIMPHLVPPIEGDAAFWKTLLDELDELLALAIALHR